MSTLNVTNLAGPSNTGTAATLSSINGGPISGARNRIINGDMWIDQRNAGASVTQNTTGIYTVDRWQAYGAVTSKFTIQQNAGSVTPPAGFTNYLGCTSSSAYTVGASEGFNISQQIEGFNTADFGWGAAGAATVILSFWVRSSLTGTFGGALQNSAQNRTYPFTYTISAANSWEQKSVTIVGDTSGAWLTNNGIGIRVYFSLGAGATWSAAAGSWTSSFVLSATGATSVVGTNGATFYITGVQLEAGTVATPFERRSYGQELALCQRYFFAGDTGQTYNPGPAGGNDFISVAVHFPVQMRTAPTMSSGAWVGITRNVVSIAQYSVPTSWNGGSAFTASAEL